VVGAALPETSLLTLQVCTSFLKKGAAAGLTLREMASAMCFENRYDVSVRSSTVSLLQRAVNKAIRRTDSAPRNPVPVNLDPLLSSDDSMLSKRSSPEGSLGASPVAEKQPLKLFSIVRSVSLDPDSLPLTRQGHHTPVSVTKLFDPSRPPRVRETPVPATLRETVSLRGISDPSYEPPFTLTSTTHKVDEDMLRRAMVIDGGAALSVALDAALDDLVSQLAHVN